LVIAELPNEANKFVVFSDFGFSVMKRAPGAKTHALALTARYRAGLPLVATVFIGEEFHWSDERFSANLAPKGEWEWTTAG
jgi:hypothetical protein